MHSTLRLGWAGAVLLGLTGAVRAGDRETALAQIDRAIKAHGGERALAKAQTVIRTGSGMVFFGGASDTLADETILALPGRAKNTAKLGKAGQVIIVLNRDRAWRVAGGTVFEVGKDGIEELNETIYTEWLATLVPLKQDGFDLTLIEGKMVDGKSTIAVKVTSKGHFDARLYFDKDTGLLLKIERKVQEAGIQVEKEYVYSGHKEFDGVKLPTKRLELVNGQKRVELKELSYQFPAKVDESAFLRP